MANEEMKKETLIREKLESSESRIANRESRVSANFVSGKTGWGMRFMRIDVIHISEHRVDVLTLEPKVTSGFGTVMI